MSKRSESNGGGAGLLRASPVALGATPAAAERQPLLRRSPAFAAIPAPRVLIPPMTEPSCSLMAERAGFEPAVPRKGHTRFPGEPIQPLWHLSFIRFSGQASDSPRLEGGNGLMDREDYGKYGFSIVTSSRVRTGAL